MDIGEGELNRLGVIRALPNACGANMLCRAVSSIRDCDRKNVIVLEILSTLIGLCSTQVRFC